MTIRTIQAVVASTLIGFALSAGAARADAQQDQQACMNDAMTICGQYIPDRERVAACLMANRGHVSPPCRVALRHFNPRTAAAPASSEDRLTPR